MATSSDNNNTTRIKFDFHGTTLTKCSQEIAKKLKSWETQSRSSEIMSRISNPVTFICILLHQSMIYWFWVQQWQTENFSIHDISCSKIVIRNRIIMYHEFCKPNIVTLFSLTNNIYELHILSNTAVSSKYVSVL